MTKRCIMKMEYMPNPKEMMKKIQNEEFDPEMLVPTKQEILEFCDSVLEKWKKYQRGNAQLFFAMNAVRMGVLWTDEDSLKVIWDEILKWAFALLYKNTIAQAKEENFHKVL